MSATEPIVISEDWSLWSSFLYPPLRLGVGVGYTDWSPNRTIQNGGACPSKEAEVLGSQEQPASAPQMPRILELQGCGCRRLWERSLGHWFLKAGSFSSWALAVDYFQAGLSKTYHARSIFLLASDVLSSWNDFVPQLNLNPYRKKKCFFSRCILKLS